MVADCWLFFRDAGGSAEEAPGKTFMYAGDAQALVEGRFDRKLWARQMEGKLRWLDLLYFFFPPLFPPWALEYDEKIVRVLQDQSQTRRSWDRQSLVEHWGYQQVFRREMINEIDLSDRFHRVSLEYASWKGFGTAKYAFWPGEDIIAEVIADWSDLGILKCTRQKAASSEYQNGRQRKIIEILQSSILSQVYTIDYIEHGLSGLVCDDIRIIWCKMLRAQICGDIPRRSVVCFFSGYRNGLIQDFMPTSLPLTPR